MEKSQKMKSVRYFRKAYEAHLDGQLGEAIQLYHKSIEAYPTAEAFTSLAWALSFLEHYDEAIRFCKKAIELDPEFGNPYHDIGTYLIAMNKLDEAVIYLEKALKSKHYETFYLPHFHLGQIWKKKGMILKARESFQRALEENPEYHIAKEALEDLRFVLN